MHQQGLLLQKVVESVLLMTYVIVRRAQLKVLAASIQNYMDCINLLIQDKAAKQVALKCFKLLYPALDSTCFDLLYPAFRLFSA